MLQEINCRRSLEGEVIVSPGSLANWTLFTPSACFENMRWPIRSCIYVNSSIKATQVPTMSPDIASVRVRVGAREILLCSLYIPGRSSDGGGSWRDHMLNRLGVLRTTVRRERLR